MAGANSGFFFVWHELFLARAYRTTSISGGFRFYFSRAFAVANEQSAPPNQNKIVFEGPDDDLKIAIALFLGVPSLIASGFYVLKHGSLMSVSIFLSVGLALFLVAVFVGRKETMEVDTEARCIKLKQSWFGRFPSFLLEVPFEACSAVGIQETAVKGEDGQDVFSYYPWLILRNGDWHPIPPDVRGSLESSRQTMHRFCSITGLPSVETPFPAKRVRFSQVRL